MNRNLNIVTVYYRGNALSIYAAVAKALGLRKGQRILSENHFWEILAANVSRGISLCEHGMQSSEN